MGSYQDYVKQVNFWRRKYGGREQERKPDLTKVSIFKVCAKCKRHWTRSRPVRRHHKGHEYLFAILLPDVYAKRYIEFRPEDTVDLCSKCHKAIHKLYEPILSGLWPLLNEHNGKLSEELAEQFRKKLVRKCNSWLKK